MTLEPKTAAVSVARNIDAIERAITYVRAVMARYEGLKAMEQELASLGVLEAVNVIVRKE